ncbi:hypothetical protein [Methylocystis sp.]|uniref:hypothetical protein n=1 Tax=Methylocystis sp. TaxID=1911079 RepID=UPI003D0F4D65
MRAVADTETPASNNDRRAIASARRYIFGDNDAFNFDALKPITPEELAAALAGTDLNENAVKFITVMAFVDGKLDCAKIASVLRYAGALGMHQHYIDQIDDAAHGRLGEVLADMTRCNMESITGKVWKSEDVNQWLLPYAGDRADPSEVRRFEMLADLPQGTFGRAFYDHFRRNNYGFPGDPQALNAKFSLPHDSVHVLTGYDTTPRGEILVSTFTAAMHPYFPMGGHILPVIFSWHLMVKISDVARSAKDALDPVEFWRAWAAGAAATIDTFAPEYDFWSHATEQLQNFRSSSAILPQGLVEATSA